jgi:hypothetical protein
MRRICSGLVSTVGMEGFGRSLNSSGDFGWDALNWERALGLFFTRAFFELLELSEDEELDISCDYWALSFKNTLLLNAVMTFIGPPCFIFTLSSFGPIFSWKVLVCITY